MPSLFFRAKSAFKAFFPASAQKRGYDGVKGGRLYADWFAQATSSDTEIRNSLRKLIDRSRDLERNNDYQRGFLFACERNTLGAVRLDLRMDAGEYVFAKGKPPRWEKDRVANSAIETAWAEWGRKGTCTVCGRYSWRDVKRLAVRGVPRDGNFIVRKIRDPNVNKFGFALQLWEIDHLDIDKFETLKDGRQVRFGIEMDRYGKPQAYWLKGQHPGDLFNGSFSRDGLISIRVPADELYHLYLSERAEQSIGVPWVVSAITRLRQLGAFEEAATIAARLGASKAGFFKQTPGPNGEVGEFTGSVSANGNPIMDAAPGTFEALPMGWSLDQWQPEYPNISTGDFRKAMLRGVATSLGMSYTTLGNDLESVNFSSARVGLFEEREWWKSLQVWYSENLYEPVFADWLEASISVGLLRLPLAKFAKFNRPIFKSRRWPFIDPAKEVSAAREAIALRITSRQQVIEEAGGDRDDVFLDNLSDESYAEEIGLDLQPPDTMPETNTVQMPDKDDTDGTGDDNDDDDMPKVGRPLAKSKAARVEIKTAEKLPDELTKRVAELEAKIASERKIEVHNHVAAQEAPSVNINLPPVTQNAIPANGRKMVKILDRDPVTNSVSRVGVETVSKSEYLLTKGDDGLPQFIPAPDATNDTK